MEARGIAAGDGRLRAEALGEIELEGNTLVIKRIRVTYQFAADEDVDPTRVDRVLGFHADHCPVARSIRDSIEITTELEYVQDRSS